jgi:hypothetical protein
VFYVGPLLHLEGDLVLYNIYMILFIILYYLIIYHIILFIILYYIIYYFIPHLAEEPSHACLYLYASLVRLVVPFHTEGVKPPEIIEHRLRKI